MFVGVERSAFAQSTDEIANAGTAQGAELVSTGWSLSCVPDSSGGELLCETSQEISVAKTRQSLLSVFVTPWKQAKVDDPFVLRLQLQHGLDLTKGVQFQIDGNSAESPVIQTSSQLGTYARAVLSPRLLASLKKGGKMEVSFTALNGKKLTIPVTLYGFWQFLPS
jgi:invasion protein IalB